MRKSHLIVLSVILIATISSAAMAAESQPVPAPAATISGIVNINTADGAQLALLPRVGAKAAQRILDYRKEHGNFKKTSDLMQVKGFGEKSYERLAAWLTVDGKTTLGAKVHAGRVGGGKRAKSAKASKASSSPTPATR